MVSSEQNTAVGCLPAIGGGFAGGVLGFAAFKMYVHSLPHHISTVQDLGNPSGEPVSRPIDPPSPAFGLFCIAGASVLMGALFTWLSRLIQRKRE